MLKHVLTMFTMLFLFLTNADIAVSASKCEFFAKADVGILEFTGTGCTITGKPKVDGGKVTGEFTVDVGSLDAGLRTKHMREKYLETAKYPKATLKLDPMPEAGGDFTGKLTLHGVEKPIKGKAEKTGGGWSFKFDVKTSEFGIAKAGYEGIEIADTIAVSGTIDR